MKEYKCLGTYSRYHVLTRLAVTENRKTVAILWQSRLATVPVSPSVVGLTYIGTHALTPVITLSLTDVDTDAGAHTQLLLSFPYPRLSGILSRELPEELASLSPPACEACAECPTAGVAGFLRRPTCPALCPLQFGCSEPSGSCLGTKAAGVSAKSLPSSLPPLPLIALERTHFFSPKPGCSSPIPPPLHLHPTSYSFTQMFFFFSTGRRS